MRRLCVTTKDKFAIFESQFDRPEVGDLLHRARSSASFFARVDLVEATPDFFEGARDLLQGSGGLFEGARHLLQGSVGSFRRGSRPLAKGVGTLRRRSRSLARGVGTSSKSIATFCKRSRASSYDTAD